jgi:hypothetical protein
LANRVPRGLFKENPGFGALVGNPPFGGKNSISTLGGDCYIPYLQKIHEQSHGASDLVAHFFRRAFYLLRKKGTFGLIATNTIAQGDTRHTGLRWICTRGGTIFEAQKRYKWPAGAAVIVSIVHVVKSTYSGVRLLDQKVAERISAFLFHRGGDEDPLPLRENAGKSFQGCILLGLGFTFDDTNPEATPISEMHRLIAKDPRNAERIFPYIGGEELNETPNQIHQRYVIDFGEMSEADARKKADLFARIEAKVKPQRLSQKDKGAKEKWWQFIRPRPELRRAIEGLERVLASKRE